MEVGNSNITFSIGEKDGIKITIESPLIIKETLQKIINGWAFENSKPKIDIFIKKTDKKYSLQSKRINSKPRDDFLDFINDLLNEIAITFGQKSNLKLIHCIAYENIYKKNILVFGRHGSGKSSYMIKNQDKILNVFSDDILLFSKKKLAFYSLGFPIRVRRPVKNFKVMKTNTLLGERLCYILSKDLFIKEFKTLFFPDYIFEMSNDYQLKEQNILNLDKKIHEYMISF